MKETINSRRNKLKDFAIFLAVVDVNKMSARKFVGS